MSKLEIKAHSTRGKEVIQLLEMLGGKNDCNYSGLSNEPFKHVFYINSDNCIRVALNIYKDKCIAYTLEEFLERYPYKIGDEVILEYNNQAYTISNIIWNGEEIVYALNNMVCNIGLFSVAKIRPYTEQEKASDREFKDACEKAVKECLFGNEEEQEEISDINWEQVRINAAIAAMPIANEFVNGLNRYTCKGESMHSIDLFVDECVGIADALIDRLKNNK